MMIKLIAALFVVFLSSQGWAQTPVTTFPLGGTTTNASSTISLTNQFQSVFVSSATRKSCTIQNTGTHVMYVFFGPIVSATSAASFPLFPAASSGQPGGFINCTVGGVVLQDQVSITGTTADTFVATSQ